MAYREAFTQSMQGDVVVVHAPEELDLSNADQLRSSCCQAIDVGGPKIVVDLSGTQFMDSTALGVFVRIAQQTKSDGGWLRLVTGDSAAVQKLIKITGLDATLGNYSSVEAAISG